MDLSGIQIMTVAMYVAICCNQLHTMTDRFEETLCSSCPWPTKVTKRSKRPANNFVHIGALCIWNTEDSLHIVDVGDLRLARLSIGSRRIFPKLWAEWQKNEALLDRSRDAITPYSTHPTIFRCWSSNYSILLSFAFFCILSVFFVLCSYVGSLLGLLDTNPWACPSRQ